MQHLLYKKKRNSFYDMGPDVLSLFMLDKESVNINERWKILVVYNKSIVKQIVTFGDNEKKEINDGNIKYSYPKMKLADIF